MVFTTEIISKKCRILWDCVVRRVGQNRMYTGKKHGLHCRDYSHYTLYSCIYTSHIYSFWPAVSCVFAYVCTNSMRATSSENFPLKLYVCTYAREVITKFPTRNSVCAPYTVVTVYHAAKILFLGGAASSHPLKYINSRGGADYCGLNLNNYFWVFDGVTVH